MTTVPLEPTIAAIVVAAGRGVRAGAGDTGPKQYRPIGGRAVLVRAIDALLAAQGVTWVLPVIHVDDTDHYAALGLDDRRLLPPVSGGAHRQASVLAGLEALAVQQPDLVLIHDAARPFVAPELTEAVIAALGKHQAALPVLPVTDTIKRSTDGLTATATEDRHTLFAAQTPQGFRYTTILQAHRRAAAQPQQFTDDAAIAEWAGLEVALTSGSPDNIKLTHPGDFLQAERLFGGGHAMEIRIGTGYDVHAFAAGDAVWLGGVRIPHTQRLEGHSDADAALHAVTDAILGALGEGDIGAHFPPDDPRWKDAASSLFLGHAARLAGERGGRIINLDITIICEAPRVGPHVPAMKAAIAEACGIAVSRIAVKATTNERLGFVGRAEGIAAMASASIELPREA